MLDGLRDWAPDILFFAIPALAGALLFIWRGGNLRRRGVVVRATCVNQARDAKGLVTLRLIFDVDGTQYYCTSMPYQFPPVGVGQRLDVMYDSKNPGYSEVVDQMGRGIVPWFVGGIATVLLLLAGISYI